MLYFRKFVVSCDFIDEVLEECFWVNWEKSYGKNGKKQEIAKNMKKIVGKVCRYENNAYLCIRNQEISS